jgi:hypothetical protein
MRPMIRHLPALGLAALLAAPAWAQTTAADASPRMRTSTAPPASSRFCLLTVMLLTFISNKPLSHETILLWQRRGKVVTGL